MRSRPSGEPVGEVVAIASNAIISAQGLLSLGAYAGDGTVTDWKVTMNASSVALSSLASSAQTTAVTQHAANNTKVKPAQEQQQDTAPAVKPALPRKVGQVIDITA